ncbi:hypothetical protein [Streptomyces sp. NPDC000880]
MPFRGEYEFVASLDDRGGCGATRAAGAGRPPPGSVVLTDVVVRRGPPKAALVPAF